MIQLDILAIAAHCDDAEGNCGGTLIKMKQLGYKIGVIDLTQGESGSRGTPNQRIRESDQASKIIGLRIRENLKLPDAKIEVNYDNKIKLVKKIRKYRPKVIILPYWEGRHPDHYNASKLGYEACFLSGLKKILPKIEPHRPFKILYTVTWEEIIPSFVVDITSQFEKKAQALSCYRSQFISSKKNPNFPTPDELLELLKARSIYYGSLIGKKYGEAFVTKEPFEIQDLTKLPVRSI